MFTADLYSLVLVNNYQQSDGRLLLFELMGSNTLFSSIKFNISNGKFVSETTLFILVEVEVVEVEVEVVEDTS